MNILNQVKIRVSKTQVIAVRSIEHVIRCLKVFRILAQTYRNRRRRFGLRFNLIAGLYNRGLSLAIA